MERPDDSIKHLQKAKEINIKTGDKKSEIELDVRLAMLYIQKNNIDKAALLLDNAAKFYEKSKDAVGKIFCLGTIARMYQANNDYEKALQYYEENISELNKMGLSRSTAGILKKISAMYREQKNINGAITHLENAALIEEESSDSNAVETYILLGDLLNESGKTNRALEYYKMAFDLDSNTTETRHHLLALKIGELYGTMGKLSDAVKFLEKASMSEAPLISSIANKYLVIYYRKRGERIKLTGVLKRLHQVEHNDQTKKIIEECLNDF